MKLDHIAIAVEDLHAAVAVYRDILDLEPAHAEDVPSEGVRAAFLAVGDVRLELLAALDESSPIAKFIARRGPGLHHICLAVDDLAERVAGMRAAGVTLIEPTPRLGAGGRLVAFVHPKAAGGVLIELCETRPAAGPPAKE